MNIKKYIIPLLGVCLLFFAGAARADFTVEADTSLVWLIWQENENGIRQLGSQDLASQEASGFYINRARISLYPSLPEYKLYSKLQAQFENEVMLLDVWLSYRPIQLVNLYFGQMKIPSTYEVATNEYDLDFIVRSNFSRSVVNLSLTSTPYISPFRGMDLHNRDLGFGIKGAWDAGQDREVLRYFFMVGNGLGANLGIGGTMGDGFMTNNNFGDFLYAIRAEVLPFEWMTIGGHYNYNIHRNMLFNDDKTVYDFDRTSWSVDCRLKLPWGFRAIGMYGQGVVDDDWLQTGKKDYEYTGWEAKVLKDFFDDKLELGVRYDTFEHEANESGEVIHRNHWTFGVNYKPIPYVRVQMNYMLNETLQPYMEDVHEDVVFLNVEADIEFALNGLLVKKK